MQSVTRNQRPPSVSINRLLTKEVDLLLKHSSSSPAKWTRVWIRIQVQTQVAYKPDIALSTVSTRHYIATIYCMHSDHSTLIHISHCLDNQPISPQLFLQSFDTVCWMTRRACELLKNRAPSIT